MSNLQEQTFVLTPDQQKALEAFNAFILDPKRNTFVLSGFAGCGKSTLVSVLIENVPNLLRMASLVNSKQIDYKIILTATTNKAAENLSLLTGAPVSTIHSTLGLRVQTDFKTQETCLVPARKNKNAITNSLIFIDEASYIDSSLLDYIFKETHNCKIVFIGDPAQLTPVKYNHAPVFKAGFSEATLTTVVRQVTDNPIIGLATKFRETVNTGEFFSFTPDGEAVVFLEREDFEKALFKEFSRPDWKYYDSKVLAWTNARVTEYNKLIREKVMGNPHFQKGDYAVCNSYYNNGRKVQFKNEQTVFITDIGPLVKEAGVPGFRVSVNESPFIFMPESYVDKTKRLKQAQKEEDWLLVDEISNQWIDLRAAYSCTVNKAQGSTFDRVFIDLDDISKCRSADQLARMLYVAVSRARYQVVFTGDIV